MRGFHFGAITEGLDGSWGEFALHLQCPWRLEGPAGFVTGQGDLWEHATLSLPPEGWSYESGDSLADARLRTAIGRSAPIDSQAKGGSERRLVVEAVQASEFGDITLSLSDGYVLRVFPDTSRGEAWRLLRPKGEEEHFVFPYDEDTPRTEA